MNKGSWTDSSGPPDLQAEIGKLFKKLPSGFSVWLIPFLLVAAWAVFSSSAGSPCACG